MCNPQQYIFAFVACLAETNQAPLSISHSETMLLKCIQIGWRKLIGTGYFAKVNTAAKPLAAGAAPRDSNFEDAVTSFVYTARMPFHPQRLYDFVTTNFHLHQRDWGDEIAQIASDSVTTIREAAGAIAAAAKALPAPSAALRRAADLAASAAMAAVAQAESAGNILEASVFPVQKLSAKKPAKKGDSGPFGRILRSKGQVWLAGTSRYDHLGDWSLAGDVLQFTSGGPWISRLPVQFWPEDEAKRSEIFKDLAPGVGDRCVGCVCIAENCNRVFLCMLCLVSFLIGPSAAASSGWYWP